MGHLVKGDAPASASPADCLLQADLAWLLKQAFYSLASEIHQSFDGLGVTPRGYHILEYAVTGEHTQSEVADAVGLDKTTMVGAVDELEDAGLAERRPSSHDRRVRTIAVTPEGEAAVLRGREAVARIQDEVLASLPGDQGDQLITALRTLVLTRLSEPVTCSPPLRRRQPR